MILLANIVPEGAAFVAGVAICFLFLWWKDRKTRQLQSAEAQSVLEQARRNAENTLRDARLAANEEALRIREETDKSFAARRQERADLERRLSERESLINTQLEKIVQAEKGLQEQKEGLQKQDE